MKEQLINLLKAFRPLCRVQGSEMLMEPQVALQLCDALQKIDVLVMGLDGWVRVPNSNNDHLMEDRSIDFYVGDEIYESNDVHGAANLVNASYG